MLVGNYTVASGIDGARTRRWLVFLALALRHGAEGGPAIAFQTLVQRSVHAARSTGCEKHFAGRCNWPCAPKYQGGLSEHS